MKRRRKKQQDDATRAVRALGLRYACRACGAKVPAFVAQCLCCRHWDTFGPIPAEATEGDVPRGAVPSTAPVPGYRVTRLKTGIPGVDTATGGGLVKGRSLALGGSEGAGKSTLSLQIARGLLDHGAGRVLYVCGEESLGAVQHRASRIGAAHDRLFLTAAVEVEALKAVIEDGRPDAVFFDSINVLRDDAFFGGEIGMVKAVTKALAAWCNSRGLASVFLAHLNAAGRIGGPRFFRHMVDAVYEFRVDERNGVRQLKAFKNRDGATDRPARFRMTDKGLVGLGSK